MAAQHLCPVARRRSGLVRGFTLVELLVALMVMAMLSVMAWRGLDSMQRTQTHTQTRADALLALQTGLAQWNDDLNAMSTSTPMTLDWSGNVLRLSRYSTQAGVSGVQVVAWAQRNINGTVQWLRWQSGVVQTQAQWQTAWTQAALWAQNPDDAARQREIAITPLLGWQVFFYRNDAWSNPASSSESAGSAPDGVRLVLTLPEGGPLTGKLTRDWIRPTLAGNKS